MLTAQGLACVACGQPQRSSSNLSAAEVRSLVALSGIGVSSTAWEVPYVLCAGSTYRPLPEPGFLLVNGKRCYSAAWL